MLVWPRECFRVILCKSMSTPFIPRLDILPPPQRALWDELSAVPREFVLWGGTGLALHLGHRQSVDFDFFADSDVDLDRLLATNPLLQGARTLLRTPGSLSVLVDRGGPVKMSFFDVPGVLHPINPPHVVPENGLAVASLLDLAAMKAKVICDRAEQKDYLDVDAVLTQGGLTLAEVLSAGQAVYGATFEPVNTLKALSYFGDGNLRSLPDDVKRRLFEAAQDVDPLRLPSLNRVADDRTDEGRD